MAKRSRPARASRHDSRRQHLGPPWVLAFLLASEIRMENEYTASISGIGTAAAVTPGDVASLTFVVVVTGGKAEEPIVPEIEIETPSGERQSMKFMGKSLKTREHITDWTITIQMIPPGAGVYRARLYLNDLQRSEMAFRISLKDDSQMLTTQSL